MANPREIRVRQLPDRFDGKKWHTKPQPIVYIGEVGRWVMVRVAAYSNACPFVLSRKEWDKLPAQGIEAATAAETVEQGSVHESPVGNADAPKGGRS